MSALLISAPWLVAAALVVRRGERHLALLMSAVGVLGAVVIAACGDGAPSRAAAVASVALPVVAFHLALVVPTGRVPGPRTRMVLMAGYLVAAVWVLFRFGAAPTCGPGHGAVALLGADLAAAGTTVVSAVRVRKRIRRSALLRAQWFATGLLVVALGIVVHLPLAAFTTHTPGSLVFLGVLQAVVPVCLVAATSAGTQRLAPRALQVATTMLALVGTALALFLLLLAGLGTVPTDAERYVLSLSLVTAFLAALVAPLVQRWVGGAVKRLAYENRETPNEMLRHLGGRLSRALPWDESLLQLAESLRSSLRLSSVQIYIGSHGTYERHVALPRRGPPRVSLNPEQLAVVCRPGVHSDGWAAVWVPELTGGREPGSMRVIPLCVSGDVLGLVVVERDDATDPFRDEEDDILGELAAQVSLATHNVDLERALRASLAEVRRHADELQASRARVVAAADDERRRIERDLHDGAQQSLIALSLTARAARQLLGPDNPAAGECLDELAEALRRTAGELRELAHGIYPPLLLESGVGVALQFVAPRCCPGAQVDATRARYAAPVEAAVYFCCLEAMQNAAKYASDGRVCIRVREDDHTLRFEVTDSGPGFDVTQAGPGQGLVNMADRIGAIGGSLDISSVPGNGTSVRGSVPVDGRHPDA